MSENEKLIEAPELTEKKAEKPQPVGLQQISRRRAARIVPNGNHPTKKFRLEIWKLRRADKQGVQKAREFVRGLVFESQAQAEIALVIEKQKAEQRELRMAGREAED